MASKKEEMRIKIIKDGPYRVTGGMPLFEQIIVTDEASHTPESVEMNEYPLHETYVLCCGSASKNKPYCDGSHGMNSQQKLEFQKKWGWVDSDLLLLPLRRQRSSVS